jgi:hypothetical protein
MRWCCGRSCGTTPVTCKRVFAAFATTRVVVMVPWWLLLLLVLLLVLSLSLLLLLLLLLVPWPILVALLRCGVTATQVPLRSSCHSSIACWP